MEIEFEGNKCWVQDASNVQLKRYLSKTRLYYRDGAYLREYFKALFPEIKSGPDGDLYYDISTLDPEVSYAEATDLRKTKVPTSEVKKIERALKTIREQMEQGNLSFNEEACIKEFTVPDPRIHPELYQLVYDHAGSMHFVILWALESTESDANLSIDELLVVMHSDFMGDVAPRAPKPAQESPDSASEEAPVLPNTTEEPEIIEPEVPLPPSDVEEQEQSPTEEPQLVSDPIPADAAQSAALTEPEAIVEPAAPVEPLVEEKQEEPETTPPVAEVAPSPAPEQHAKPESSLSKSATEPSKPEIAPVAEEPRLTSRFGSVTRQIPTQATTTSSEKEQIPEPKKEEPKKTEYASRNSYQEPAPKKSAVPASQPKSEPKPVAVKKPVPVVAKPAKVKVESAPRKPLDPEQKQKLIKIGILAASILVAFLFVREIMVGYLGRDVIIATANVHPSTSALQVKPGDQVLLPQGNVFESFSSSTLLLAPIEKPGDYSITNLSDGSGKELLRIRYLNARNDFMDRPIASLLVLPTIVNLGEKVEARVDASFHKSATESIQSWSVTWGDGAGELTPITDPSVGASHSYEEPGSYRVSLIVRDKNNLWDEDNVIIEVQDPESESPITEGNRPPVADAEIVAIEDLKDGYLVKIALDHSFDPDGIIANLSLDWGDGSPLQQVDLLRNPVVERRYAKALPRATVRVHAFDRDGERSRKPAIVQLDFQSSALNDAKRFRQEVIPYTVERVPVGAKAGELVVQRRIYTNAIKNKLHQHWFLCNPIDQAGRPLRDVVWTIRDQKKVIKTVNDTRELSLMLAAGRYTVEITAKDFEGNTLDFRQTFIVDPKPRMSGAVRFMNSIANGIPLPSIARMFN